MIQIDIPGLGHLRLEHLVSDFTGTLSVDGKLLPGIKEMLNELSKVLRIHILTADTFGTAKAELENVECDFHLLAGDEQDVQKEQHIRSLGIDTVAAVGNGNNDRRMLRTARIGVAVCLAEGCSRDAVMSADVIVTSAADALALFNNPKRLKATLRF